MRKCAYEKLLTEYTFEYPLDLLPQSSIDLDSQKGTVDFARDLTGACGLGDPRAVHANVITAQMPQDKDPLSLLESFISMSLKNM